MRQDWTDRRKGRGGSPRCPTCTQHIPHALHCSSHPLTPYHHCGMALRVHPNTYHRTGVAFDLLLPFIAVVGWTAERQNFHAAHLPAHGILGGGLLKKEGIPSSASSSLPRLPPLILCSICSAFPLSHAFLLPAVRGACACAL